MSKQRVVKDEIWDDDWFFDLDPSEKLVWLFLLTNPRGNVAGIYKLNKKWAAQTVGLDVDVLQTILLRFVKEGKILDEENWIALVNFHKHLAYRNASVAQGILRIYKESTGCPQSVYSVWLTLLNSTLLYLSDMVGKMPTEKREGVDNIIKEIKITMSGFNKVGEDYLEEDFQIDPDHTPKGKKKEKKVSDEIQQVFDLFNNPARVTWRLREIERVAAQALFETYGVEKLKLRIDRIEKEKGNKDPLFPHVATPSQLLDKMPNVERYFGI